MCGCGPKNNHYHDELYLTKKALKPYYTKAQVDALLEDYYTQTDIDDLLDIPSFLAYQSSPETNKTGDGTVWDVACDVEVYDHTSDYSVATRRFIAPEPGIYQLSGAVVAYGITSSHTAFVHWLFTSNRTYRLNEASPWQMSTSGAEISINFSVQADMDAGDEAYQQIAVYGGSKAINIHGAATLTYFSGHLVRRT